MNKYIKALSLAAVASTCLTSCLDEFNPTQSATSSQLATADKESISNGVASYMITMSEDPSGDIGFAGFGIWRDAMTADFPIVDESWDYYPYYCMQTYLGNWTWQTIFWRRYYGLINNANIVLSVSNPELMPADAQYTGNALVYRAMAYLDMQRMYEYRLTGVANLDGMAQSRGILGLTVPIVTEKTTESEGRNNPRVPFWHLYRFILTDLQNAEKYLSDTRSVATKTNASLGTCYGMLARLWLEMGSRFDLHDEDLQAMLAHEDDAEIANFNKIAINSARDCYAEAARYARLAISEGYTPLTQSQWFDSSIGFNTPNQSWMWCSSISQDDEACTYFTWQSFPGNTSPECNYGTCTSGYNRGRMIDAALFGTLEDGDWRKTTWIAPDDVADETAYNTKYAKGTSLTYSEWAKYGSYVGLKFHPAQGERNISSIGNAVSNPLMRVEEMYLIEAEAVGRTQGYAAGASLLETFLNGYRYSDNSYVCPATSLDEFVNEVFRQKRIEFWGEGQILWDYIRLEKAIRKGYTGTNHPRIYQFNSFPGYKAPWTNFYIPDSEKIRNAACILNPDPSNAIAQWK